MLELNLSGDVFADKVRGCWLGKNAGGTLGTPLEEPYGRDEPFDVWWYPQLQEGGLPNDDLEIQLIWLKALEEVGPTLSARDLSRYWLDHVGYNFDEYGVSKANLRLGLEPPISGAFNNWFADCMGCPIRSEIWACVAPGVPRIAARYAYEDAICDHAGGESIYGELFNVAVQSSAFVLSDRRQLVDVGLSYVHEGSATFKAITAAVDAWQAGDDWLVARRRVMDATPHYNAQYSPINLGFQVIGLLYGDDFGDGLCKTVDCGYDTDSSGATIGSYLGILYGAAQLPAKWTDPLGETIATNESWGGVRHLSDVDNPAPSDLDELTVRIRAAARSVMAHHGILNADDSVAADDLYADTSVTELLDRSSSTVRHRPAPELSVDVDYGSSPVIAPGSAKEVVTSLVNHRADPISVQCAVVVPSGWDTPESQSVSVPAGGRADVTWQITAGDRAAVDDSNRLFLQLSPDGWPVPSAAPIVLLGATAWRLSGSHDGGLGDVFDPEDGRNGSWREVSGFGHKVPLDGVGRGVTYAQTYLVADAARELELGVKPNIPALAWLNGALIETDGDIERMRPSYGGQRLVLQKGWNELLIKLQVTKDAPECHVVLNTADQFRDGIVDLGRTRFPWDYPPSTAT